MALSKPCCSLSITNDAPQPSTSAAAVKQMESEEIKLSLLEHEKKRIQFRAARICSGCRCGWLCCDCSLGCLSCKQRRRFCYCQWATTAVSGQLVRIPCLICLDQVERCTCKLMWRCKWCIVSIKKCKRGGCVTLLPDRMSPEAAAYVEIFNREDDFDDEEIDRKKVYLGAERNLTLDRSSGRSVLSVGSSASSTTLSSVNSEGSDGKKGGQTGI